jgi:SAM-dependent MidA family methyltransferase
MDQLESFGKKILQDLIVQKVRKEGPLSFADYMELALYHPQWGYYTERERSLDYYTNVDVHPIYGRILGHFFCQEFEKHFRNEKEFRVIELGAGTGKLAKIILEKIEEESPECFSKIRYCGIETSPARKKVWERLHSVFHGKSEVRSHFNFQKKSIAGMIFSNEFFDALPVHRVKNENGALKEICINETFHEILAPLADGVGKYFDWLGAVPREGHTGEAHCASRIWMETLAQSLRKGSILTIDYGFPSQELYSDLRPEGTAVCHARHKIHNNFYGNPGTEDITAHVNFTTLMKAGEEHGLQNSKLETQSTFLTEHGLDEMVKAVEQAPSPYARMQTSLAVKSLIHPEGMGGTFKCLLQRTAQ